MSDLAFSESATKKPASNNSNLFYLESENYWKPIPEWSEFCFELGALFSSLPNNEERSVIAAALPTRAFAASFAAVGAIIGQVKSTKGLSGEEYFQSLCDLPIGTNVKFLARTGSNKERIQDGVMLGCQEMKSGTENIPMLKVQLRKSKMSDPKASGSTHYVGIKDAHKIRLVDSEQTLTLANLPTRQKGVLFTPLKDFAKQIIGKSHSDDFVNNSHYTCLLVGNLGVLRQEVLEETFATCFEGQHISQGICQGNLLELLRVRKFTSRHKGFRSDAFASNSRKPPRINKNSKPDIVIFDGANGFLKWRDYWRDSHWVILLDQTEAGFTDAVNTIDNIYLQRTGSDSLPENFPYPPDQIEIVYFQEKIK